MRTSYAYPDPFAKKRRPKPTSKACTKCKQEKPLEDFYRNSEGPLGRTSRCIECLRADYAEKSKDPEVRRRRREQARKAYHDRKEFNALVEELVAEAAKRPKTLPTDILSIPFEDPDGPVDTEDRFLGLPPGHYCRIGL